MLLCAAASIKALVVVVFPMGPEVSQTNIQIREDKKYVLALNGENADTCNLISRFDFEPP